MESGHWQILIMCQHFCRDHIVRDESDAVRLVKSAGCHALRAPETKYDCKYTTITIKTGKLPNASFGKGYSTRKNTNRCFSFTTTHYRTTLFWSVSIQSLKSDVQPQLKYLQDAASSEHYSVLSAGHASTEQYFHTHEDLKTAWWVVHIEKKRSFRRGLHTRQKNVPNVCFVKASTVNTSSFCFLRKRRQLLCLNDTVFKLVQLICDCTLRVCFRSGERESMNSFKHL